MLQVNAECRADWRCLLQQGTERLPDGAIRSPYTAPALIMTGGQALRLCQYVSRRNVERQRLEEEARMLAYGQNVGTYIGMPEDNHTGKYEYANQSPALTYDEYGNADIYQSGTGVLIRGAIKTAQSRKKRRR